MSPEYDRDSQRFKLLYFATYLRRVGSLKKPYFWTEWVGMAKSDIFGCIKVGLLLVWNSFSLVIPAEHNNLAKTTQKCLWCSWSQFLMVLSNVCNIPAIKNPLELLHWSAPYTSNHTTSICTCLALVPGCKYFCYQKVGSTNQISECCLWQW